MNLDKLLWGVGKRLHNVIKIPILNIWFCIAIFGILFAILGNQINQIVKNYKAPLNPVTVSNALPDKISSYSSGIAF